MRTSVPQTHPPWRPGKRWRYWCSHPPGRRRLVEAWRPGWDDAEVLDVQLMSPEFNVWGLFWCPLSKPRLEPEVRGLREGLSP